MNGSIDVLHIKIARIDSGLKRFRITLNYYGHTGTLGIRSPSTAAQTIEIKAKVIRIFILKILELLYNVEYKQKL